MSSPPLSIYCPHCHKHTSLDVAPAEMETPGRSLLMPGPIYTGKAVWKAGNKDIWWIGICNSCHRPVLVHNQGDIIYPAPLPSPTPESVPEDIRSDLDEAKRCATVSAWRACAVMARRAMQSAAILKGAKKGKLVDQVDELWENGVITKDLKEWADTVRWVGNDAAHPDSPPVSREDAEAVLRLAEGFLEVLFVVPATAKSLQAKRRNE